ncbi:putative Endonuclease-reverse transcriptase-containing protein 11, partial [Homarus americanus]
MCGECGLTVKDSEKAASCDVCEVWFHIECEKLPEEVEQMTSQNELEGKVNQLREFTEQEHDKNKEIEVRMGILEAKSIEINDVLETNPKNDRGFENRLETLEARTVGLEGKVDSGRVTGSATKVKQEDNTGKPEPVGEHIEALNERKKRENNIVVYGVPESGSPTMSERIESDKSYALNLIKECGITSGQEIIIKVIRLGKFIQGKARPMLVKLSTADIKANLFRNIRNLQDKLIELNAQLKEMENTLQVIALQEVKPKHYRYEWITAEYNLEGYDIREQNLLNKEGRGDFNLPQINWSNYTSVMGLNDVGTMFIEKVRDCFLTQHIEEITRIRGDSTGNTLDLLFSNEESIVGDIKLESPLGKSDHACIYFHCDLQEMEDKSKKQVYMYEKADYLLMKQRLTMDWIQYLSLEPDIESKWNKFKGKFQAVIDECVPKKIIRGLRVSRKRTNEKLPMNKKLWAKVKKKQRLWERLKIMKTKFNERACTREMYLETEKEYRRLNNQVRWETRNILKRKEQEIAKKVKANPKVFWKYVQTKTRTKARIADLYKDEEKVQKTVNDQEKAD